MDAMFSANKQLLIRILATLCILASSGFGVVISLAIGENFLSDDPASDPQFLHRMPVIIGTGFLGGGLAMGVALLIVNRSIARRT